MENGELIPHLFRMEYRKIVSVLAKYFGSQHIDLAEDIASETFLTATQTWGINGIPVNPAGWLYAVARNKAINQLKRNAFFEQSIAPEIKSTQSLFTSMVESDIDLSPGNINDSQLQMIFCICHPSLPKEAQVGLALRILCGFGIEEIATAFLTNRETINKRLQRAKQKLRELEIAIALPQEPEMEERLNQVLTTIYLLFNEGYYSVSGQQPIRRELCFEAMRLCYLLIENKQTNKPRVNALLSLMCFHASRLDARTAENGELILYDDQDQSLWNSDLVSKGAYFLNQAASGSDLSAYHLQAGIAYWHTQKTDTAEKWETILQFYNLLLQLEYSPIAALNRTYALSKVHGKEIAIKEAEKLRPEENHFYYILLGELYTGINNRSARVYFEKARELANTSAKKQIIGVKLDKLD
jgi:RNA polymerase sigma-70 factor (ECF subfamily)